MGHLSGVIAATPTPVGTDGEIDHDRLIRHCRWLLDDGGCDGVNLLGTTGEATSFSRAQRLGAMAAVAGAGLPLDRLMVGTGAAALADALALTRAADDLGFAGALLLPPFYYTGIEDAALADFVQRIIDAVVPARAGLYLYHIPQFSGVPYPIDVVAAIARRNHGVLRGVKDSSGDPTYAVRLAQRLPGIDVFPSSEGTLAGAREHGFAGCISATTNVTGTLAQQAWAASGTPAGERAAAAALDLRTAIARHPLVPAVKCAVAHVHDDPFWERVLPPLTPTPAAAARSVRAALAR